MSTRFSITFFMFLLAAAMPGVCQYSEDVKVHDPVIIKENDTYYVFATGKGISVLSSKDMKSWKQEKPVFEKAPDWTAKAVEGFRGHFWAPDISLYNGRYYLYYSISAFGKNTSAIGLAINKTLESTSPDFKWIDQGMVIQSVPGRDLWNAIDPNVAIDDEGNSWLVFGSFWEGIKLVKLATDRTSIAHPEIWHTVAKRKRSNFLPDEKAGDAPIEAPFLFKKNGYYFLFVSWDYCCKGKESTYKVVVGRSRNITGPYIDKAGKPMGEGGGSIVIEGNENFAGVGHNSAATFNGKDYLVFHAYDLKDEGHSKLKIKEIDWSDDWPSVLPMGN